MVGSIVNITDDTWDKVVHTGSSNGVVLVDFTAKWCPPCQQLGPVLEKLCKQEEITLAKYDIDESSSVSDSLRIASIPAVFAYSHGKAISKFAGNLPEASVLDFIRKAVSEHKKNNSIKE